uniref:RNA helicase n=1 Tax=Sus scrofa TaxID=9823 RepID=A0A8D0MAG4_PIG
GGCPGCGSPDRSSPLPTEEPSLASLFAQVDLCLGCSRCTQPVNESTYLLCRVEHTCPCEILLARFKPAAKSSLWRKVDRPPTFPRPARYTICRYYSPGLGCRRHHNQCTFARSPEEALVWIFEREHNVSHLWLKTQVQGGGAQRSVADAIRAEFGGHFLHLCAPCFRRRPPHLCPVDSRGRCPQHGDCPSLLAHVSTEGRHKQQVVEVREHRSTRQRQACCKFVGLGWPCRQGASRCHDAHSTVEMAVWRAEERRFHREDLLKPSALMEDWHTDPQGQSSEVRLYCHACLVTCCSQEAFENHCFSLEHAQMLALDSWAVPRKHRSPPAGLSTLERCPRPDLCEFGDMCTKAHSEPELQEWTQRARTVALREQAAWRDGLVPYQARLLAEYQRSSSQVLVLAETLDGVSIHCDQPLVHQAQEKQMQHSWTFTIHSEAPLLHVALLKQEPGSDFSLVAPGLPQGQVFALGERFCLPGSPAQFQVVVHVQSTCFGTFEQWLVFDFGRRPALLRKLELQLGSVHCPELRGPPAPGHPEELERWHTRNRLVVPGVERTAKWEALMAKYKLPALMLESCPGSPSLCPISPTNYRQRLHQRLYQEEAAQQQLVAKLNFRVPVSLKTALEMPALGTLFPPSGALYGEVPIPHSLALATDQGFLLGRMVSTALVAPVPGPDLRVFEVPVETRASSEQALWLLLPTHCCTALGLQPETRRILEVQFQLDPLAFPRWHQAVDALPEEWLVLPNLSACALPCPSPILPAPQGNSRQKLVMAIVAGTSPGDTRPVAPLLVCGPFGTGKTYALAMASLEVIRQPGTKVLICTHTNSTADSYIAEYFHPYTSRGHPEAIPLRVMDPTCPPRQTDAVTLRYCCLTEDRQAFRPPTRAELEQHRVVVASATQARGLRVPAGFFSHILIDEAAQMLEWEALTPLRYATPGTRVVLAGDHMRVAPRLFSAAAGRIAGPTLLHRLLQHFREQAPAVAQRSCVILCKNYRSTEAIVRFVSRHFSMASGSRPHASGKIPPHPHRYPLLFCHAAGVPEQDVSMTSWLNAAEVVQVVEKVQEVYNTWPHCWGLREQKDICVVSCGAQVSALRQELRKRDLGQVSVCSFEILPGRAFRVVVLSTVHNHRSLLSQRAPAPEFFTDACVLHTVMTHAQSQVVAVGDAVALCSFGTCSRLWKGFIRECVAHQSICPEGLSLEQIQQSVVWRQRWAQQAERCVAAGSGHPLPKEGASGDRAMVWRGVESEDPEDFWPSGELRSDDDILQELLDGSRRVTLALREDGLLGTFSRPLSPCPSRQYVNLPPAKLQTFFQRYAPHCPSRTYYRCTFQQETLDSATALPLEDGYYGPIQVKGRQHCGMAFPGDEVMVKVIKPGHHPLPLGSVLSVLQRAPCKLVFVCRADEWDPCLVAPINGSVTKIFVPGLKDRLRVPVHRLLQGRVQRVGYEQLSAEARRHWFFRVRVILWRERFYYPLGVILKVLPEATTWEQGLRILRLEYGLKGASPDPASVYKALQMYQKELSRVPGCREDCRSFPTFTVDPQGAFDLDDALSVRDLGSMYEVAVHIADVASCVPRDGALDLEARRRGSTLYAPGQEPVHMLPAVLSQDAFSLLPGRDRLTISLFLTVEKGSDQLKSLRFAPSVIRSDRQMSYEEAEQVIRSHPRAGCELPARLDSLDACVAAAYHFSRVLRRRRLHDGCHYEQPDEDSALGFREARIMIKEYMVQYNSLVAAFLVADGPTERDTPLRWQLAPSNHKFAAMWKKHGKLVPLSLQLSHLRRDRHSEVTPGLQLHLLASVWKCIQLAAHSRDFTRLADLITTDDVHPSLAVASLDWRKGLGRAGFGPSSVSREQANTHFALEAEWYTWATSPIRRYVDVVLQRQILRALGLGGSAYSHGDVIRLCHYFTRQHVRSRRYERRVRNLHLGARLKNQPQSKLGFVAAVEAGAGCFKLFFPANPDTLPDPCPVFYTSLQLAEDPRPLERPARRRLVWRRRIYSVQAAGSCSPLPGTLLDPHTRPVDGALWQRLLGLVKEQRLPEAAALVREQGTAEPRRRELGQVQRSQCGHFVEVARELGCEDALQVQFSATLQRGFLAPALQLWTVAPGFCLCLEHVERPGDCFSRCVPQAGRDQYHDLDEYARVWEPFCSLESATNAVVASDSVILQDVAISWDAERTPQGQLRGGTFCLEAAFLLEHGIDISFGHCYLCIRLEGLPAMPSSRGNLFCGPSDGHPGMNFDPDTYTWVAHGLTEDQNHKQGWADMQEAPMWVHFSIHHVAEDPVPEEVLRPGARFTIEVLPKQLPDLRKEEAVHRLQSASPLVISIALGQPIPTPRQQLPGNGKWEAAQLSGAPQLTWSIPRPTPTGPSAQGGLVPSSGSPSRFLDQQAFDMPGGLHKLNPSQNTAVREALKKQFTVIHGPPGTGKTVVGLHIAYWLCQSNEQAAARGPHGGDEQMGGPCLLLCSPSSKSVDVLAELLLSRRAELKPLRVYGEQAEATEFPVPGVSSWAPPKKTPQEERPNQTLRSITLHHRIRQASNPYAADIRAFDARLQNGETFSQDDLRWYRKVLQEARKFEVDRHRVLLCTCSCAASASLRDVNIRQILVDEAGLASEPETLIPLVSFSQVEKVVLLGDHKQLRPVVKSEQLQNLGLDRSLLQRYRRDASMLDLQYCVHESICAFPSMEFYKKKLKTWQGLRLPPSILGYGKENCSVIFGDVQSPEESLVVSTEEGRENSKVNKEQAALVVCLAKQLVSGRVDPKDMAILTPYHAQVLEISKRLEEARVAGVTVCSITKSQGEWRYVLVSTVRTCQESDLDLRPTKSWLQKSLGFLVDPNQVNVALTRAQEGLWVVGDRLLLRCCPLWSRFLDFCEAQKSIVPACHVQVQREIVASSTLTHRHAQGPPC